MNEIAGLDRHERAILVALQQDARLSVQQLAEIVGLSPSPTWRRLKSLEQRGFIRDYVARLDGQRLGLGQTVFCNIVLARHNRPDLEAFEAVVLARPEVLEFYSMTGGADYLLRIVTRSPADYEAFLKEVIFSSPAFQHVNSNFALREIKHTSALPIAEGPGIN
ncbi:Lrp/AsnC family transcriptional regulator [Aureimonas populi]|uniref:Lrp/AsnC family transcriptional regulator n=1 Tax=Aureimonas populi TaxID=1701758 RepID=A0ABW5CFG0_9HYPH|nr:Lrp/AsnC family transcriptional regulator [Aureimonas populi]